MKPILRLVFATSLAVAALGAAWRLVDPPVGPLPGGGIRLPTGQTLHPAGDAQTIAGRPVDLVLSPDARTLFAKDNRGIVVVDSAAWTVTQELAFPVGGGSLHGIATSADGRRVFATNSDNRLVIAAPAADGKFGWEKTIEIPGPGGRGASFPCGIALAPDGKTAWVCLSRNNAVAEVDLETAAVRREIPVGVAPYDLLLLPGGKTLAVTNWGGRRPRPGERAADSAGTPTLVDPRGVAASGTVSFIDPVRGVETAQVATGLHPSDLALSPDGKTLATADANSDTVTLIDAARRRVVRTVRVRPDSRSLFGAAPTGVAFSPDGRKLFVACGGVNAIALVEAASGRIQGWLPSGWYPGAVAAADRRIFVADVKGIGSRGARGKDPGRGVYHFAGTLRRLALPDPATLARWSRQVAADTRLAAARAARESRPRRIAPVPIPARPGEPSLLRHVVYIIKENRTYDQILGDLPQGNGDPTLCLYPRATTPNHHALAEEFVLLDNFYCNGVLSADGHSWSTEGNVTDHLEKSFGGFTRSYTFGDDPLTYSSSGFLWDGALAAGKTFVNFGEMDYADEKPDVGFGEILKDWQEKTGKIRWSHRIGIERLRKHSHPDYPGWNMDIPDVLRADLFLKELARWEMSGRMPNLTILYLPSDHTTGMTPGGPTPRAYLADNDLALGRVVEGISKSRFWPTTAVFVVEDDPQDGFDHVDGHRSLCLVVSPYSRRGTVVSAFYNQTSVLHTIARILGVPPMNQMDAQSPTMQACFQPRPDLRPYVSRTPEVALTETVPPSAALQPALRRWAAASRRLPRSRPDGADEDTFNRILWHAAKGDAPYPAHLAGAHGRGLAALGLRLAERKE